MSEEKDLSEGSKITLYCDIDGVLNIAARDLADTTKKVFFRKVPSIGRFLFAVPVRILIRQSIIEHLKLLPVHWVWLTTWNFHASKIEKFTGLESHETIIYHMSIREFRKQTRKYDLLKKHQAENPGPFIWIDDVATMFYKEEDWTEHPPRLVIRPQKKFGITEEHLEEIKKFIEDNS